MPSFHAKHTFRRSGFIVGTLLCLSAVFLWSKPVLPAGFSRAERAVFQNAIIDYRSRLHPRYRKIVRKNTRYIIVHTSEGGKAGTLQTVTRGKRLHNGRRTYGGHAHYVIDRSGGTYRTLDKRYRADHAGKSMWNGQTDISSMSIGIELVGYHYAPITARQYRSVGLLIAILKDVYHLKDRDVLTHSQIAYGEPNRWIRADHRGRKRCAKNFQREKAGLGPTWRHDPDVRAGRLTADPHLALIFYSGDKKDDPDRLNNMISKNNSAWAIAGEDYNSRSTVYRFPDGQLLTGHEIDRRGAWSRIPPKTVVLLNQQGIKALAEQTGPVKTITNGLSAWSFAGPAYNDATTFYFLPRGIVKNGRIISDWDDLPHMTRLIVGYRGPYPITPKQYPYQIAGQDYKSSQALYYYPSRKIVAGSDIRNFDKLPAGTLLFIPDR